MRQEFEQEYANRLEDNFRGYSPKRMIIEILGKNVWDTLVDNYIEQVLKEMEPEEDEELYM